MMGDNVCKALNRKLPTTDHVKTVTAVISGKLVLPF